MRSTSFRTWCSTWSAPTGRQTTACGSAAASTTTAALSCMPGKKTFHCRWPTAVVDKLTTFYWCNGSHYVREILAVEKSSHLKCFHFLVGVFYVRENVCYKKVESGSKTACKNHQAHCWPTRPSRSRSDANRIRHVYWGVTGIIHFLPLAEFTFFPFTSITQQLTPCLPVF